MSDYHRWNCLFKKHVLTSGANSLANDSGAYWLMDIIASHNVKDEFQVWKIKVKDNAATIVCDDGNGNVLATQDVEYTDFPFEEYKLYCVYGSLDGINPMFVIMLPSEY